ncbi:MAG: radical SAM protein [Bacteroidetes bacterium]|nr:radical SAM protein [Bacteroidota bacterium]HET6245134.1 radical SAM protein [Bacteroidia bacterium]
MKKLRILLISPTGLDKEGKPIVQKKTYLPGLTMAQLSAHTPKDQFEVHTVCETSQPIPWDEQWDIVGLTGMGGAGVVRGYQIGDYFKAKGATVVMGGIAISLFEDSWTRPHCNVIINGEAEETWPRFLQDYLRGEVKDTYDMEKVPDVNCFPVPDYQAFDAKYYGFWRPVQATRGCPFPCTFCSISQFFKRSYRKRPVEQVIRDVRAAKASGSKYIAFIDDNIGVDFNYCKELWTALIPEKIIWISQCSLQIAKDDEMLKLAYKSGCRILSFGIETINEASLVHIDKEWNEPKQYDKAFANIRAQGIEISTEMILGLDGDDETVFEKTFDFLMRNNIALPRMYILTPVPGTPMYRQLEDEGRIFDYDIQKYVGGSAVFHPKGMSAETLQQGYWKLYEKLYSRKNIYKRLKANPAGLGPFLRLFVLGTNVVYRNHINRGITPGIV